MYWDNESWGSAEPPDNAEDVINYANDLIAKYAEDNPNYDDIANYSADLWEKYCMGQFPADLYVKCK